MRGTGRPAAVSRKVMPPPAGSATYAVGGGCRLVVGGTTEGTPRRAPLKAGPASVVSRSRAARRRLGGQARGEAFSLPFRAGHCRSHRSCCRPVGRWGGQQQRGSREVGLLLPTPARGW